MELTTIINYCISTVLLLSYVKTEAKAIKGFNTTRKEVKEDVYLFGVTGSRKPYNFINDDGKLVGFDIDIIKAVCAIAKKECHNVLTRKEDCIFTDRNVDYAGPALMSGAIQGCSGYQITRDRQNEFAFTVPYLNGKSRYAVSFSNPKKFNPNMEDFSQFILVHVNGSPFNSACLIRLGKAFNSILVADSTVEAEQMLINGKADVLLTTRSHIPGLKVLPTAVQCDGGRGTGLMMRKGSSVSQWWDSAFQIFYKSGSYNNMCKGAVNKYGDDIHCLTTLNVTVRYQHHLKMTKSNADNRPDHLWKFVVSGRIAPYSFINKAGELVGFTKDFILNVCKIAGKQCVLMLAEVRECSVRVGELLFPGRGLESGWFDACTGYFSTVERRNSWDFTDPYLVSNASFYVLPGNPSKFNPNHQNLSSFTIVYQATAITNDHCLHRLHKTVGKLLVVENSHQAAQAVYTRKADAWFTKLEIDQDQGLLQLPGRYHCEHVGTSVMVRKGSQLKAWWNKAFRKFLVSGQFQEFCKTQGHIYKKSFPCATSSHILKDFI